MSNTLLPLFRSFFPEFAGISDAVVDAYLVDAGVIFCASQRAQVYLAAHLLVLDQASGVGQGGTGGVVDGGDGEHESEKVGEISVTVKTMAESNLDSFYTTTPYGRKFLAFKKASPSYRMSVRVFNRNFTQGIY